MRDDAKKQYAVVDDAGMILASDGLLLVYVRKRDAEKFCKWHTKKVGISVHVSEVTIHKVS